MAMANAAFGCWFEWSGLPSRVIDDRDLIPTSGNAELGSDGNCLSQLTMAPATTAVSIGTQWILWPMATTTGLGVHQWTLTAVGSLSTSGMCIVRSWPWWPY